MPKIFYNQSMWDFFEPKNDEWYRWDLNGASALLQKKEGAWHILFNQIPFDALKDGFGGPHAVEVSEMEDKAFSLVIGNGKKAALRPYLSGMPYLVTVKDGVRIMPGAETRFDVMLPPLIRFETAPHEPPLAEIIPFVLSRTWFGDSMSGIFCHSLPSFLVPRCDGNICPLDAENPAAGVNTHIQSLIHCELLIRNTSKAAMNLKQTAIYTDMLNVYEKNGKLETDEVILDSLGDENLKMSINHEQKKGCKKLSSSINGGKSEVLIRRGVEFLKNMNNV